MGRLLSEPACCGGSDCFCDFTVYCAFNWASNVRLEQITCNVSIDVRSTDSNYQAFISMGRQFLGL